MATQATRRYNNTNMFLRKKGSHPEGGVGPLRRRRTAVLGVCGRMRDVGHKHKERHDLDLSSESERERAQKNTHTHTQANFLLVWVSA